MRIYQKLYTACNETDLERIIVEGTTVTIEKIDISNTLWYGIVWKTKTVNIINDLGWDNTKDYIKWLKSLDYREVNTLDSINIQFEEDKRIFKKYLGIRQQVEAKQRIKVIFQDNDFLVTSITGSYDDIINHYDENNKLSSDRKVKKIEFLESPMLKEYSSCVYMF